MMMCAAWVSQDKSPVRTRAGAETCQIPHLAAGSYRIRVLQHTG